MTRSLFVRPLAPWLLACLLFALLAPAIILNNFHYLFRTDLYEFGDLVVNSLQILKAKGWGELYGQYSRWGFHHPGPAFFYVQAAGESVFFDWTHVVPRPLNAQMLATALLNACFLSAGLATAAHWVGARTVFLPLALALGLLHIAAFPAYGFKLGALMLMGNWPGYLLPIPFGMMLLVLASVGAGRGESLPWAVLIGGFLAHGHITQAGLFVPPLCLLAYTGLVLACRRPALWLAGGTGGAQSVPRWPWQVFPRAHLVAAGLLAVFALPLLLDLARGSQSNLARILAFRRSHAAEAHKPLLTSLLYFLQFGAYQWFRPSQIFVGTYPAQELWKYFKSTRVICEFWLLGLFSSLMVMASWYRFRSVTTAVKPAEKASARRRYTVCLAMLVGASVLLTLVWGCVMNGEMVYYNAFINYAIFYAGMLVVAAAATDVLCTVAAPEWSGRGLRWFLYAAVGLLAVLNADRFRMPPNYGTEPGFQVIVDNVAGALRAEPAVPRARYLSFFDKSWTLAVDVALLLERQGHPYLAAKEWEIPFGEDHCPAEPVLGQPSPNGFLPFGLWRIVPVGNVPAGAQTQSLIYGYVIMTNSATIDPGAGDEIRFGGANPNDTSYMVAGWADPGEGVDALRWTGARQAVLSFRAKPVPTGSSVRLIFDCVPFSAPGKNPQQRMEINLNGTDLGTWQRASAEPFEVTVPAVVWNARGEGWLWLRFPDAITPSNQEMSEYPPKLAFGFRHLGFRVEPDPSAGSP